MSRGNKTKHPDGMTFRSDLELHIYTTAKKHRKKLEFEPHFIPYIIKGNYLPDFLLPNGIYVEAKGRLDAASMRKMRCVKASNPKLDIRFVFQNANQKLNKRSKLKHWEWAEKYGFPWAEGTIPLEWFKEKPDEAV
jgi:hypothetical protein